MSSDEIAIRVEGLGKRYEIYDSPRDRLKQFVVPRLRGALGMAPRQFYREFWALRDVSFEIRKGEAFGVVGRNGSGKSTLLQLITGTLSPTTGSVLTQGRIAALLELGSGFNPEFTGRENVFLNGMVLGLTRREIEDRFDEIAAFADIGEHIDQPIKTYSSGMIVRLAFAVQVQMQPDILIVDEALAVGDALFQKRCYERIERLLSDGVTLMFVSHDQESVRTLTRRSLLLKNGGPVLCASSSEVILAYRKLLHDEESAYFAEVTRRLKSKGGAGQPEQPAAAAPVRAEAEVGTENVAEAGPPMAEAATPPAAPPAEPVGAGLQPAGRSAAMSFGDGGVTIADVQTCDAAGEPCSVFYPGDALRIRITCLSEVDTDHLNVGVRIRNKEGVKIYSWGTLNQDMQVLAGRAQAPVFWERPVKAGERFDVWLECDCPLGPNLYEIQASVAYEAKPDYTAQRLLHWRDEAAFFQVAMRQTEYFFGGIADLRMKASWREAE
ncbi:ABC transporter ATP-binding protein [Burkholderiaceae bacterium FT117]|uniref:ABC transporter ATP-binding protein n=1 Tax=Zeimonas sediminis TaxID=2944268 RepID=UPI002342FC6F|nr:ABC transporter ATP-binding protein [Zeimonas sediminis]MCM5572371.1 ABC transporter ATP-binding protein [Zeimonas sediminis]